jgi:hypothetical protein
MYNLGNAAPVVNPGYYDVPIHNQYSNPVRGGHERRVSNYNFNTIVGDTINDNDDNYEVSAMPTTPSPSLYVEQNAPMSGYEYGNNLGLYNHVLPQKRRFYRKQIPGGYVPPQVVEGFENSLENYQGMGQSQNRPPPRRGTNLVQSGMIRSGGAGGVRPSRAMMRAPRHSVGVIADGARRDGERTVGYQQLARNQQIAQNRRPPLRHHYPRRYHGRRPRHYPGYYYGNYIPVDYINIGSIPNIAGYYDNMEDDVDIYEDDMYDDMELDDEEANLEVLQNVKIENIKERNDNEDINTLDSPDDTNASESAKKKNKKNKKMKSNPIYLVIFLLIIMIIVLLFLL